MCALGIIVEYNPFHNGHLYHLNESKKLSGRDRVVAVMSGNHTQRGEPAICDKWRRTRMALEHGVDLVIELPVVFAAASSEYFADAAVKLLHGTGLVDCLCFGSESDDIASIMKAGRILSDEPPAFKTALQENLRTGQSFAAARAGAISGLLDVPEGLLTQPNNGLGIEYCKALYRLASPITPLTIRRSPDTAWKPARSIRQALAANRLSETAAALPPTVFQTLSELAAQGKAASLDGYSDLFQYRLRTMSRDDLREIADMTEGLENRFRRCAGNYRRLSDLLAAVKTRRYTLTRLQRIALHTVLGITREAGDPPYIRVLGFRRDSADLLGQLKAAATLPVIVNLKHAPALLTESAMRILQKEIESTGLYTLASKKSIHDIHHEYKMPLVIL